LLIKGGVAEALHHDPLAPLLAKSMGAMVEGFTKSLDAAITKAVEEIAKAQTLSHRGGVERIFGPGTQGNPERCFGDWCLQVAILGGQKAVPQLKAAAADKLDKVYGSQVTEWSADTQAKFKAALAESSGVTGGYTVPPDFYQQILTIAGEEATFRQYAFVQPMSSATMQFPFLDITTVQAAGNSPFFGGVVAT
jgi:HK97 family phage major capsid protein